MSRTISSRTISSKVAQPRAAQFIAARWEGCQREQPGGVIRAKPDAAPPRYQTQAVLTPQGIAIFLRKASLWQPCGGASSRNRVNPNSELVGSARCADPAPYQARNRCLRLDRPAPFLSPAGRGRGHRSAMTLPPVREVSALRGPYHGCASFYSGVRVEPPWRVQEPEMRSPPTRHPDSGAKTLPKLYQNFTKTLPKLYRLFFYGTRGGQRRGLQLIEAT